VDPLKQRPLDPSSVAPIDSGRESASGERVAGSCDVLGEERSPELLEASGRLIKHRGDIDPIGMRQIASTRELRQFAASASDVLLEETWISYASPSRVRSSSTSDTDSQTQTYFSATSGWYPNRAAAQGGQYSPDHGVS
jgi:hypothetical protein